MKSTRRTFLKMTGAAVVSATVFSVTGAVPANAQLVRPPGAVAEDDFKTVCLRCHQCLEICPEKAIKSAHLTDGWSNTGTPVLENPCTLCMKCAEKCPSGALSPIDPKTAKMGTAFIIDKECVGCDKCIKPCPTGAITKVPGKRLVTIDPVKCTGCTTCVKACPVTPIAIKVTSEGARREPFKSRKA